MGILACRKFWSRPPCRLCHCSVPRHGAIEAAFRKGYFLAFRPPTSLRSGWSGLGWNPTKSGVEDVLAFLADGRMMGVHQVSGVRLKSCWVGSVREWYQPWKKGSSTAGRWGWIGSQTQVNGPSQILDTRVKLRPRQVGQVGNKMFPPFSLQPIITYYNYNRLVLNRFPRTLVQYWNLLMLQSHMGIFGDSPSFPELKAPYSLPCLDVHSRNASGEQPW